MSYKITQFTRDRAKEIGVEIYPSKNPKKKLDVVFPKGAVVSIGAMGYGDFPTYMKTHGMEYALKRRLAYHMRHRKDDGLAGQLAKHLLW
jgi:hypothetical protein